MFLFGKYAPYPHTSITTTRDRVARRTGEGAVRSYNLFDWRRRVLIRTKISLRVQYPCVPARDAHTARTWSGGVARTAVGRDRVPSPNRNHLLPGRCRRRSCKHHHHQQRRASAVSSGDCAVVPRGLWPLLKLSRIRNTSRTHAHAHARPRTRQYTPRRRVRAGRPGESDR